MHRAFQGHTQTWEPGCDNCEVNDTFKKIIDINTYTYTTSKCIVLWGEPEYYIAGLAEVLLQKRATHALTVASSQQQHYSVNLIVKIQ